MKILLSPSKTANHQTHEELPPRALFDPERTNHLMERLNAMDRDTLQHTLSLSDKLLQSVHPMIQSFFEAPSHAAFTSFTGLVYQQLDREHYSKQDWAYVRSHIRILDALYGILEPGTPIRPYRLDMKAKWDLDLYAYWADVAQAIPSGLIVNLASEEFSRMIDRPMLTVRFLQRQGDTVKTLATYAKMGRGALLNHMIRNHVTDRQGIEAFQGNGYRYDATKSDETTIVFVRG